jgi:NAD(P)-dependent dehydrogenase (short-subunit alcohol dehydrogenase family)
VLELEGRGVLIMGAPAGFARGLALRFAEMGADIALTTATNDASEAFELRRAARAVVDLGRMCLVESVDMSIGTGVQVTVRQVAKALGRIDIAVLAPDVELARPADRISDADWAKVIGLNLNAVFYACRAIAREMARQGAQEGVVGRIVVVTRAPELEDGVAYRTAKAGLWGLVEALAAEWRDRGISVELVVSDRQDEAAMIEAMMSRLARA